MKRVARFVRARLHRRLFVWFGITILVTLAAVAVAGFLVGPRTSPWHQFIRRAQSFVGGQIALVWDDAERRDALLESAARELDVDLVLTDSAGNPITRFGAACRRPEFTAPVLRGSQHLGELSVCAPRSRRHGTLLLLFGVAGATLWVASGLIARRLVRPLGELVRVTNAIGSGDLKARARLGRQRGGEIGALGEAINDMAMRIERQMSDQRELLAAVSHEIRSPLSRIRVLVELARTSGTPGPALDDLEREVEEVDSLVGQLLASSRLDFAALDRRPLDASDLAIRSLERAGLPPELLESELDDCTLSGDPTLIARALDNLLDNAKKHAGGARALRIVERRGRLAFVVEDAGPGISALDSERLFESFVRGERSAGSSLGLGLALVRRIARAHGGEAWAENRAAGGASIGFSIRAG